MPVGLVDCGQDDNDGAGRGGAFPANATPAELRRESRPAVDLWNAQRRQGEALEAQEALHLLSLPAQESQEQRVVGREGLTRLPLELPSDPQKANRGQ